MFRPLRTLRTYRRLRRYRQVIFTLIRHGFDDIVDRIGHEGFFWRSRSKRKRRVPETPVPARLRQALEDLGPTFIKFGQLLSTRPDVLPLTYIEELEKLQDNVPPFAESEVEHIFREELGSDPLEIFSEFNPVPIASGSIAQVHRAKLKDNRTVAVKIQRPRIRRLIETDIDILREIAALVENHIPEMRWLRPGDLVDQFSRTIRRELDFVAESQAMERFRINFERDPSVFIPAVHRDYSTVRILTTDFVEGVKITNFGELERRGFDRLAIARNGAKAVFKEVFEHRLFHADPHPGNFFVQDNHVIAIVDFGIVGRLDEKTTDELGRLLSAVVQKDVESVIRVFRDMEILGEDTDISLLKFDLLEFLDAYHGLALGKIDAERMIHDLLRVLRRHHILLPVNLALIGRMLAVLAGVGRMLDPTFDMITEARPFVESFLLRRFDPRKALRNLTTTWQGYQSLLRSLPEELDVILSKVKRGKMLMTIHHEGLSRFILEMDRSSNRLTFGLIIAALIVGSSLVMQLEKGPMLFGFPALGLGGYVVAGILGLWLVVAILRSGRI